MQQISISNKYENDSSSQIYERRRIALQIYLNTIRSPFSKKIEMEAGYTPETDEIKFIANYINVNFKPGTKFYYTPIIGAGLFAQNHHRIGRDQIALLTRRHVWYTNDRGQLIDTRHLYHRSPVIKNVYVLKRPQTWMQLMETGVKLLEGVSV